MSEVAHDILKGLKLKNYRVHKLVETATLNVSTERLITMGDCASRFQSDIVQVEKDFLSLLSLTRRDNERPGVHVI